MMKINIKAIALGCLADWAGTAIFGIIFSMSAISIETSRGMTIEQAMVFLQQWSRTSAGGLFWMLFGLGFTCLGGYVAARLSRDGFLINAAGVGTIAVLPGLPVLAMTGASEAITLLPTLLSIPAAVLGGLIYLRKTGG